MSRVHKRTARDLKAGKRQVATHGRYTVTLKCTELHEDDAEGVWCEFPYTLLCSFQKPEYFKSLRAAHTRFNTLLRNLELFALTQRLLTGGCPSELGEHSHKFAYDHMDNTTVCIFCGMLQPEILKSQAEV